MIENKKIIYLLRVNPDPEGTLEIDGERFRVYEETDSEYSDIFKQDNTTKTLLDAFAVTYRNTRDAGKPHRNLEVVMTEDLQNG